MKKAICYAIGLVFALSAGMAYMESLLWISFEFPFGEHKLLIGAVFYIILPIIFVLFLTRYNFAAANAFGKMRYAPLFLILGLISAVLGGVLVIKGIIPDVSVMVVLGVLFGTVFVTYKVGRLIAKRYKDSQLAG